MDLVNIGGRRVSVAGVLLSLEASVVRIVELDDKSSDSFPGLFHANQHASATIGQPIQGVDVVHEHDLTPHLQLQHLQEGCVLNASRAVRLELLHYSARILGLDGEEFSANFVQLGIVSGVHLGVSAVDVEGIGVDG